MRIGCTKIKNGVLEGRNIYTPRRETLHHGAGPVGEDAGNDATMKRGVGETRRDVERYRKRKQAREHKNHTMQKLNGLDRKCRMDVAKEKARTKTWERHMRRKGGEARITMKTREQKESKKWLGGLT